MKKKIVAMLLCVLIVCTVCISLVACDEEPETMDNYVGNYVGYIDGKSGAQLYMTISGLQKSAVDEDYYPINIQVLHPNGNGFSIESKLIKGEPVFINAVGNTQYIPLQNYSISELTNDKLMLRAVSGQIVSTLRFKSTELSLDSWKDVAWTSVNGGYVAYYYEG